MKPPEDERFPLFEPERHQGLGASDTTRSQEKGVTSPDTPTVDAVLPPRAPPGTWVAANDTSPNHPNETVDAVPTGSGGVPRALGPADSTAPTLTLSATIDHSRLGNRGTETVPGTVAGYEILSVLGRGAMGVVYKARQRGLQRLVALKMILSGEHASEHEMGRFRSEANAVAQLQHPNIVQIYEVGEDGGRPFFSLEFVDGLPLDQKIRGTLLPPEQSAILVRQLAEAMAYAHQHGVIHRDLKPANILLTADGIPKIGDFGLAKRLEEQGSALTQSGAVLGTPSYMSPEQAAGLGDQVGPRSDVYSLGAILYELLTSRPPFRGTSVLDTLHQLRTYEPIAPGHLQPGVPRDLETICLECLQKEQAKRYPSAGELAADLKRFIAGEPILARPIGRPERMWRWCKRNPRAAVAGGVFVLILVGWAVSASALAWQLGVKQHETEVARHEADENAADAQSQKNIAVTNLKLAQVNEERHRQTADRTIKALVALGSTVQRRLQSKSTQASPRGKTVAYRHPGRPSSAPRRGE